MRKLTLSIGAAVLATAGVALAAPAIAQHAEMTRAQVEAKAAERFAKMDLNNDGLLNAADREARRAKAFDRLDADNNGSINETEFNARRAARAEQRAAHAGHEGVEAGKRSHRMGGHRIGGRGMGRMAMARMADTNNDQAISRAEFTAAALAHFDKADADNNGTVTQAERKAAHEAMRAQWQAKRAAAQPVN
jgi:hypothetical protein